jgi:hypothetical protein
MSSPIEHLHKCELGPMNFCCLVWPLKLFFATSKMVACFFLSAHLPGKKFPSSTLQTDNYGKCDGCSYKLSESFEVKYGILVAIEMLPV